MPSHYNDPAARLAGLDTMVLRINRRTTATDSPASSFVKVPRTKQGSSKGRAGRTPLRDKTPDYNSSNNHTLSSSKYTPSQKSTFSIYEDSVRTSSTSRSTPFRTRSSSFKPLPPVRSASTLRLPSFLDLTITPSASPTSHRSTSTRSTQVLGSNAVFVCGFSTPPSRKAPEEKMHDEPYIIPAFQHPNSPYVPWASPIRRRILRPTSSCAPSTYTAPSIISRSGARAPEPEEIPTSHNWGGRKVMQRFRKFRGAFNNKAKKWSSRICIFRKSQVSKATAEPPNIHYPTDDINSAPTDDIAASARSASSLAPMLFFSAPSMGSLRSSDTSTLGVWLASRNRASSQMDYEPQSMMTLDEYERRGSWLDLSRADQAGAVTLCGVPGCEMHMKSPPPDEHGAPSPLSNSGSHLTTTTPTVSRHTLSFLASGSVSRRSPSRTQSFPELPLARSSRLTPTRISPRGRVVSHQISPPVTLHRREMSMPGGWTL